MSEQKTQFPQGNHPFKEPSEIPRFIRQSHEDVRARWMKIDEAMGKVRNMREELDKLLGLGSLVDSDDVIKSAAKLVGKGVQAHAMASFLADMPQMDGEPIHLWLRANEQKLLQREQALKPVHDLARHELGLSALRVLTAGHLDHMEGGGGQVRPTSLPMESPQMMMENNPQSLMGAIPQGNA